MPPARRKSAAKSRSRRSMIQQSATRGAVEYGQAGTKTVITETVVRRSLGSALDHTSQRLPDFAGQTEAWELKPKTDYTYARSPTYSTRYIGQEWVMPNMSRPRLRGGAPVELTPISSVSTSQSSHSERRSSSRTSLQAAAWTSLLLDRRDSEDLDQTDHATTSHVTQSNTSLHDRYVTRDVHATTPSRKTRSLRIIEDDQEAEIRSQRLDDSVTRSGRRGHGSRTTRQSARNSQRLDEVAHTDVTDLTMDEYMRVEKQLEYSGHGGPYKESSRLSLYGLDEEEVEPEPPDQRSQTRHTTLHSRQSSSVTRSRSIITTVITIITSILYTSWRLVTRPVVWLVSGSTFVDDHHTASDIKQEQAAMETTQTTTRITRSSTINTFSDDEQQSDSTSKHVVVDDDDSGTESLCNKFCFYVIFCIYLVCVELPIGLVGLLRRCASSIYRSILVTTATLMMPFTNKSESFTSTTSTTHTTSVKENLESSKYSDEELDTENDTAAALVEDEDNSDSYFSSLCYYLITVAYLCCVEIPVGVFGMLGRSVSWLYNSIFHAAYSIQSCTTTSVDQEESVHTESQNTSNKTNTVISNDADEGLESSGRRLRRSSTVVINEDEDDVGDSICARCCYYFIALVYLLCVHLPLGIAKTIRRSVIGIYSLFISIVDGAKWATRSSFLSTESAVTTTTVTTQHTTTSTFFGHIFGSGSRLVSAVGYVAKSAVQNVIGGIGYVANGVFSSLQIIYHGFWEVLLIPWVMLTSGGAVCCSWCWQAGVWLHHFVARVLLFDVWLLSRTGDRRGACCCLLPLLLLLLLLPFLLLPGSRYFLASVEDKSAATVITASDSTIKVPLVSNAALREIIEQELLLAKADLKSHDSALYKDNLAYIERLESQLEGLRSDVLKLETAQLALLAQLKDCCHNETALAGLVKDGVHEQLATIMYGGGSDAASAGVLGSASDGSTGTGFMAGAGSSESKTYSNTAFVSWLNSQFAKPGEFDNKIAALTAELNKGLKEQAEATRAAALVAYQAEQAALGAQSEADRAAGLAVAVQTEQSELAAAWDRDKKEISGAIAGAVAGLQDRDDQLTSDVAAAAALAAAAKSASDSMGGAVGGGDTVEDTTGGPGGAGAGVGVGTGCGCNGQAFVLPDTYQAITEEQVKLMIREALGIFGADKTGMVDYALESAGGSVISTRCSETYHRRTAQLSLFGIPLWYTSNSPRTVIQPEVQPGQCWAFRGTQGYIVIQLAGYVQPTAFSLEHIPKVLSPSGKIDSAPKDFTVWGLKHERDVEGRLLGNYTYLDNGEPLQFFPVTETGDAFHMVELRILSNHGSKEYTCLYRFRVHGLLQRA